MHQRGINIGGYCHVVNFEMDEAGDVLFHVKLETTGQEVWLARKNIDPKLPPWKETKVMSNEPKLEMFGIHRAMNVLAEGHYVARSCWPAGAHLRKVNGCIVFQTKNGEDISGFSLSSADLNSSDWYKIESEIIQMERTVGELLSHGEYKLGSVLFLKALKNNGYKIIKE